MPSRSASLTLRRRTARPSTWMLAGVRRVDAGEDFHERRFAGAVFADDGKHFAGLDVQVDVLASACTPGNDLLTPIPCGGRHELESSRHVRVTSPEA